MQKQSLGRMITALVAVCALPLAACARTDSPSDEGSENPTSDSPFTPGIFENPPPSEPQSGGTLTIADYSEARSLDPSTMIASGYTGGNALVAVYDQLVRWNVRDQAFEYRLAESVEPNDDHTQWTITLRDGVEFSDGTPLNADAVIGSFNHYIQNGGYDMAVVGPLWGGAERVDDRTVRVTLKESWATFPFALTMGLGFVVAPSAIADGPDNFQPIGAGAFTLENYAPAEELVLARNPNHWDGEVYLDKLRFVWLGGDEAKVDSFNGDAVQAALIRDAKLLKDARDDETPGWIQLENLGNMIMINADEGRPGEDPRVRQAVAHALDEEAFYERVFDGLGAPSKHLFMPGSQWYSEDIDTRAYDPDQATELVEQAKSDGFDGKLTTTQPSDPASREQALALEAQLEAVGFEVENEFVRSVADYTARVYVDKDYEVTRNSLSMNDRDPYWRLYSGYHSQSATNAVHFSDPEYDALIEELRGQEGDGRRDVLHRIDQAFSDKLPVVNFAGTASFMMWADDVHGLQPTTDAMVGFEKAWLSD